MNAWYTRLFNADYLRSYAHLDEIAVAQTEEVLACLGLPTGARILDLAGGYGRIAVPLAQRIERTPGAALDYAAVVDAEALRPLERLSGKVLLALAVRFGATRLIDNLVLEITAEGASEASL